MGDPTCRCPVADLRIFDIDIRGLDDKLVDEEIDAKCGRGFAVSWARGLLNLCKLVRGLL